MVGTVLLLGGVGTGLLVGGVFGTHHAFEADHVAAVTALVENRKRPVTTGVAWGVGHSMPILALGAVFLALDLRIPGGVATVFEGFVATILVVLGVRVLLDRAPLGVTILQHVHLPGSDSAGEAHRHVSIGGREFGLTHTHADEESFAVGIVHGLAGSGGVVVALAAAAPTVTRGAAFLVGFSVASIAAMGLAAWVWGRTLRFVQHLRVLAGVASIGVGFLLFAGILGFTLPV